MNEDNQNTESPFISKVEKKKQKLFGNTTIPIDDPRFIVLRSALEMADPVHNIKASQLPIALKDEQGYLLALTFDITDFRSYEVYSYVEETLKTEVEDLSIFHDPFTNQPTGLVVLQLIEDVSRSRLRKLAEQTFKGHKVEVCLFSKERIFSNFLEKNAQQIIESLALPLQTSTPVVLVQNFTGADEDLMRIFGKCGRINLYKMQHIKKAIFYTLFYETEAATKAACRLLNGVLFNGYEITVVPLYPRAVERCFGVVHCDDLEKLKLMVSNFGKIETVKVGPDGVYYFLMESTNSAKYAATLINSKMIGSHRVYTFFVEYEYFRTRIRH